MASKDEIMRQLQQIQDENAALHDQISVLKQQKSQTETPADPSDNGSYAAEIAAAKAKLCAEEQETLSLKRELARLIQQQEEIQKQIDCDNALVCGSLAPMLKHEEAETERFYAELLAKCEEVPGIDVSELRALVSEVQKRRRSVAEETEENQKIMRLIRFNKAQTAEEAKSSGEEAGGAVRREEQAVEADESVFDNPLPCFGMSVGQKRLKRRVTFSPRKAQLL